MHLCATEAEVVSQKGSGVVKERYVPVTEWFVPQAWRTLKPRICIEASKVIVCRTKMHGSVQVSHNARTRKKRTWYIRGSCIALVHFSLLINTNTQIQSTMLNYQNSDCSCSSCKCSTCSCSSCKCSPCSCQTCKCEVCKCSSASCCN